MNSMHAFLVSNYLSFIKAAKISQVKANYQCFKTQIGYEVLGEAVIYKFDNFDFEVTRGLLT